jgi:oxidoreductase
MIKSLEVEYQSLKQNLMQTIKLNNGIEMPVLGYGVFQVSPEECERCVLDAIGVGYRLIDTAQAYYNEEGVGNAVVKCGVPRNELFLTTKVWITNAGEEKAARSIDDSLRKLRTDYIDLLLIHQPFSDYPGTWRAMEKAVKAGKVRAIGLSNFYPDRFVDMAECAGIKPAVNQLKTNVFSQQWDAEAEMKAYGSRLMAWGPLAQGDPDLLTNPVLVALASKHGKTVQQVALRYLVQRDIIAIPKSTRVERMAQNLDVFDFTLSPEDMESIRPLDKPVDFRWSHRNPELVKFLLSYDKQFNPGNR